MTPRTMEAEEAALAEMANKALDLVELGYRKGAREALMALRAEVVKLDDLRRDAGSAEAMNHRVLALIDAALEPTP